MAASDPRQRCVLLIAGAGRSGTSLFAGLLGRLGFHVPLPEVSADPTNPLGFGEPRWVVDFNNDLLRRCRVAPEDGRPEAWDKTLAAGGRADRERLKAWLDEQLTVGSIVIKDPRLAWLLPMYVELAADLGATVGAVTLLRHPAESIRSRELAYGTASSPTTRTAGWLNMMLGTEARTRGLHRAFVGYDALLADWRGELRRIEEGLRIPLVSVASESQLTAAGGLVDPSLRRAEATLETLSLPESLSALTRSVYAALERLSQDDDPVTREELDKLRSDYARMYNDAADLTRSRVRAARAERRAPSPRTAEEGALKGRAHHVFVVVRALSGRVAAGRRRPG